jgi:uncharacterized protein DUF3105
MASRKEEKERLRAQRLAAEAAEAGSSRRRLVVGYVVAGVLTAAVVAGLIAVLASGSGGGGSGSNACANAHVQAQSGTTHGLQFDCRQGTAPPPIQLGDLKAAAQKAGCQLKLNLANEGNTHIPDTTPFTYKTIPPTSGNHNPVPAADGAYTTPLAGDTKVSPNVRNFVHSMEHGRVEIHYNPRLPEQDQLALKGVFDADPGGMLLFPDPNMPFAVAVTAWTQLMSCQSYSPAVLDAIRDFREQYRGNGPETQIPINF